MAFRALLAPGAVKHGAPFASVRPIRAAKPINAVFPGGGVLGSEEAHNPQGHDAVLARMKADPNLDLLAAIDEEVWAMEEQRRARLTQALGDIWANENPAVRRFVTHAVLKISADVGEERERLTAELKEGIKSACIHSQLEKEHAGLENALLAEEEIADLLLDRLLRKYVEFLPPLKG